jgi:ubiquinone/menaquinone biosynthesis C-methylase UbiE
MKVGSSTATLTSTTIKAGTPGPAAHWARAATAGRPRSPASPGPSTRDQTNTKENEMTTTHAITPDLGAVKQRQQQAWASGDFHAVAARIVLVAEQLVDSADLHAGWRVLDVATGSGNAAIAAARLGCEVVGVDYVPALLDRGRLRAAAEGLDVALLEGDAEALPFPDRSFDAVTSVFGSMFAPDHQRAASELLRVCRPGGTIALASWMPEGFIGQLFRTVAAHVPPPAGVQSPMLWGKEAHLRELFGDGISSLDVTERTFTFRFRSAEELVDFFRTWYGPTLKAFAALEEQAARDALDADLVTLARRFDRLDGGDAIAIPATYTEAVAVTTTRERELR